MPISNIIVLEFLNQLHYTQFNLYAEFYWLTSENIN